MTRAQTSAMVNSYAPDVIGEKQIAQYPKPRLGPLGLGTTGVFDL